MAAPFVFDYLARLIIAPQPERAILPRAGFVLARGFFIGGWVAAQPHVFANRRMTSL